MMKSEKKGAFMTKIIIEIKSTIDQLDDDIQKIEMTTEGELYEKNGHIFLVYQESELSGMEGSKTMLKITGDTVTMNRFGGTSSKMIFDIDHPSKSVYHTPYGDFDMVVTTEYIDKDVDVEKASGHIRIKYNMLLENVSNSINQLEINIRS